MATKGNTNAPVVPAEKQETPATPVEKQVDVDFFISGPSNALSMTIQGPAIRNGELDRKSVYAAGRALDQFSEVSIFDTDGKLLATARATADKWLVKMGEKNAEYERSDARKPGGFTDEQKIRHEYKDLPIEQVRDLGPDLFHLFSQTSVDLGIRAGRGAGSGNATIKALRAQIDALKKALVDAGMDPAVIDAMIKPQEKALASAEEKAVAESETNPS